MRAPIACAIALAASACIASQSDTTIGNIESSGAVRGAGETSAAVGGSPASALDQVANIAITGCCSMIAPPGAVVTQPAGPVIDGFAATQISAGEETVTVRPLLGSYGWLSAEGGTRRMVDGRPAREAVLPGGRKIAIPLRTSMNGRNGQMTLQIASDCRTAACPLLESIMQSMQINDRWSAQ